MNRVSSEKGALAYKIVFEVIRNEAAYVLSSPLFHNYKTISLNLKLLFRLLSPRGFFASLK